MTAPALAPHSGGMDFSGSWIVGAIIGAEIAFWVLLVLGLLARYVLKLKRTSTALLLSVPLADLVLIILVGLDLSRGSEPTSVHGLAAVYLGFSVGFGHYIISRADAWFAHRFADGPGRQHTQPVLPLVTDLRRPSPCPPC